MSKAVFIDRDGVINNDDGLYYIYKPSDFKLNEGIIENLYLLKTAGFKVIIISNQGGIGKGIYKVANVELLNQILTENTKQFGFNIDEIYYCPHHSEIENCLCRKPGSLLIEKAMARFDINPALSYFIGDGSRDIEAAESAGVKGILVPKNANISEICKLIVEAGI